MNLDKNPHETVSNKKILMEVIQKFLKESSMSFLIIENEKIVYSTLSFPEFFMSKKHDLNNTSLKDFLKQIPKKIEKKLKKGISQIQEQKKGELSFLVFRDKKNKRRPEIKLKKIRQNNKDFIILSIHEFDDLTTTNSYNFNQKELETIISSISSRFAGYGDTDTAIYKSLRDICILTESCRTYIVLFNEDKSIMDKLYEWCNEGIKPQFESFNNFKDLNFHWWMKELRKGQNIFIPNVSKLPLEALNEKKILEKQNVKSLLVYPIYLNSILSGFIGIDDTKGNKTWKDLDFTILRIISNIIGNFIEKERTEKKLKKSEAEYQQIIENLNECYFEVDLKGNFKFFNQAVCKKLGYSKNELLGMNYEKILDQETKERITKHYNDLYENENPQLNKEYRVRRKDGEYLVFQSSVYLRLNSEGNKIGFYGLARDITEKKRVEGLKEKFQKELERKVEKRTKKLNKALKKQKHYQEEILKASKFKSEFLATMSHELRTPLNAIIGFTDLLLEGSFGELNSEQTEYLTDIKTSAEHQYEMISNILDITKIESGKVTLDKKLFSLNSVIDQVKSTIKSINNEKGLHFEIKGLDHEVEIYADPIRFKEILLNLLSNAIKFTENGKITLIIQEKFDKWIFKVRDTGIGIARDDFDLVFKEFKRVDSPYVRSTKGTGLGLSLTKRLVELHSGEIKFSSVLGVGTTFTFFIPKKLDEPQYHI